MATAHEEDPIRVVVIDTGPMPPASAAGRESSELSGEAVVATGLPSAVVGLRAVDPDLILLRGGSAAERAELVASVLQFEAATSRRRVPVVVEDRS